VHTDTGFAYVQVFYTDVQTLSEMPDFEMAEVRAAKANSPTNDTMNPLISHAVNPTGQFIFQKHPLLLSG